MATITSTIGTNSRQYSTLALWAASLPGNLVTAGNAYVGECYNDSEFTSAATLLTLTYAAGTTSASCNITLTAAAGQSFADNAGVQTNALAYNAANGVGIRSTANYDTAIVCSAPYTVFSRIQIKNSGTSHAYPMSSTGPSALLDGCIVEGTNTLATGYIINLSGGSSLIRNCLIFNSADGSLVELSGSGVRFANCILAKPAGGSVGIIYQNYSTTAVFENCGFFGSSVLESGHGTWAPTYTTCATDSAITSPPTGCASTAYSTATFANITSGTHDYRLVSGSGLVDAGTTDTTDIPAAVDIVGTSRPQGTAWDIGCWELAASGTNVDVSGVSSSGAAAALTPSLSSAPLGVAAAAGAAALTPSLGTAATAATATGAVGAVASSASRAPAAVAATGAAGALSSAASIASLAAATSATAASLVASVTAGPSGVAVTGQAEAPSAGALPGVAAIAATAGLVPSLADSAGAVAATGAAASVTAGSGTHVALTGAASAGAAALLGIDLAAALAGIAAAAAAGTVAQAPPHPGGVAATGIAAALGIVSEITLSPAVAFAIAAAIPEPMAGVSAFGIAGPVSGYVPALVADPVFIARGPSLRFIARGPALRFTAIGRVGMRTNDLSPPIAAQAETRTVTFDFGPQLAPGVTLTAIEAMNASVHWGYADPTPDANWQGAAQIIASPTTGAAAQAVAQIYGNVPGATVYLLQCEAAASDGTMPVLETTLTSYVPS